MFRQDRHQAEDQRQLTVVGAGEIETNTSRSDLLDFRYLDVIGAVVRPAFIAQQFPRENNVIRRDRSAVGKARGRIDRECHVAAGVIGFDSVGEQAIECEGLVIAARQQALDRVAADIRRSETFDDQMIETVESAQHALDQLAAFAGFRIGISRRAEIRRPGRFALHGDGMLRQCRLAAIGPERRQSGG